MSDPFDLRVVQLLNARVCHDLAGPIGAIGNGLDLMDEVGLGDREALDLVRTSARDVGERLRFMRVAYGFASGAVRMARDAKDLMTPAVLGRNITLVWPEADAGDPWPHGDNASKLLLLMTDLASHCVFRGGTVEIFVESIDSDVGLTVTAQGQGVRLDDTLLAALSAARPTPELTPRTVHAYLAGQIARGMGGALTVDYPDETMIAFRATVTPIR